MCGKKLVFLDRFLTGEFLDSTILRFATLAEALLVGVGESARDCKAVDLRPAKKRNKENPDEIFRIYNKIESNMQYFRSRNFCKHSQILGFSIFFLL